MRDPTRCWTVAAGRFGRAPSSTTVSASAGWSLAWLAAASTPFPSVRNRARQSNTVGRPMASVVAMRLFATPSPAISKALARVTTLFVAVALCSHFSSVFRTSGLSLSGAAGLFKRSESLKSVTPTRSGWQKISLLELKGWHRDRWPEGWTPRVRE